MKANSQIQRKILGRVLLVVVSLITGTPAITGCRAPVVETSDANAANEIIVNTFQQWKSGRTIDDLRNAQPPIYVAEDLWFRGYQLKDFSVERPGEIHGTNIRFGMKLRLIDLKGKESSQSVNYLVTTTPAVTIARQDN